MTDGPYDAFEDPYCYKGTDVLKNKLGLRDATQLEAFEVEMTTLRAREPLPRGGFDARHYRRVHHHLFQDVYSWAGKDRGIRIAKGGNMFCFPEHIDGELKKLFATLSGVLQSDAVDAFVVSAAAFLGELNAIHPFREGNGRAQLAFMSMASAEAGYPLDFSRVRRASFLPAMIASYDQDYAPLETELTLLLT